MAKDALDDIARKQAQAAASNSKYTDPGAMQGFKRDEWHAQDSLPSELSQTHFLLKKDGSSDGTKRTTMQEMPDDLVKFLNDAGPLQRKVDKDLTSSKVYDSLLEEEEQRRQQDEHQRQRRRRVMPMIENDHLEQKEMDLDGTTVSRTTNFSTATSSGDKEERSCALEDKELFQLLADLQANEITPEDFVQKIMKNHDSEEVEGANEQEETENVIKFRQENISLLENMKKYTGIPTIMQDTDKSFVGAWSDPSRIEKLQLSGVRMLPSHTDVKLSFQYELESERGVGIERQHPDVQSEMNRTKDSTGVDTTPTRGNGENGDAKSSKKLSTAEFLRQARNETTSNKQ